MTDVTEIQIETEAVLPNFTVVASREADTIVVAGTKLIVEGVDRPPTDVTDEQFRRWSDACSTARAGVIWKATEFKAYGYVIGRALLAKRAALKASGPGSWKKWLAVMGIPKSTADDYIDVFENRNRLLGGGQSSEASELPSQPTHRRIMKILRRERRPSKSGDDRQTLSPSPTPPDANATVELTWGDPEAFRDEILETVNLAPPPSMLAHELVTAPVKAYIDLDWLEQRASADPMRPALPSQADRVADQHLGSLLVPLPNHPPAGADSNSTPPATGLPPSRSGETPLQLVDKYKPRKFVEVVGQEAAVKVLKGRATSRVPLRLLLIGPAGSGKTSLAWIVARRWCCTGAGPQEAEPCEQCDACEATRDMEKGDHTLIRQVSAGTYGKSDIASRAMQDYLGWSHVVIVNEADKMKDAALGLVQRLDAFEKMSVIFCACDLHALEGNQNQFKSRLKTVQLGTPSMADVARRLLQVASAEGVTLSSENAAKIAVDEAGVVRSPRSALIELEDEAFPD